MKLLGILLCYNDGDLLGESIEHLLASNHDLVVWDHGSDDETPHVIDRYRKDLRETKFVPRDFDFYQLYPTMSQHIIDTYAASYDWVTWPDQDEFVEGPTRATSYVESLREVYESPASWIRFNNYNFWFTDADDPAVVSSPARVRHYCLFPDCAPRIRSWRASATNIRVFNHNPPEGDQWPTCFNLRHYPARSRAHMTTRVLKDRAGLRRGNQNYHYENMGKVLGQFEIRPDQLHYDDGVSDLNPAPIFNWRTLYGYGPGK